MKLVLALPFKYHIIRDIIKLKEITNMLDNLNP